MLQQRKQEIIAKVQQCIERGNALYGITLPKLDIRFDLKGRAAGMACKRGQHYYLRFNTDMMLRDAWDHIINNTVPHEVAHSFCQFQPRLGSNHDAGWARVCQQLGGTGARCHKEAIVMGKGTTYEYTTDRGHKVRVGERHHNYLQTRGPLTWRKGKGTVAHKSAYTIVGVNGRTIAEPRTVTPTTPTAVVPTAPVAPVQRKVEAKTFETGASKASVSRSIMLAGYTRGQTYEQIILAMMAACGYDRQLARATYKANYMKVGCPAP